ncbi:Uncharacterised protein [Klebsiella quasipneumoniae]|nr:Uncharacterised protein [Klebsiella quasipneumoniae]
MLQHCRRDAEEGCFPPARLADIAAPAGLRSWLSRQGLADVERAESVVALWGYPANSGPTLSSALPPEVARTFDFADLAQVLETTNSEPVGEAPPEPPNVYKQEVKEKKVIVEKSSPAVQAVPEDKDTLAIRELDAAVGDWMLKGVTLDGNSARFIRATLAYFFEKRAVFAWAGISTRLTLYVGNTGFVNIELPEAQGNRGVHVVKFIPQSEYEKRSVVLTDAAMALARFGYYRETNGKTEDWSYPQGKEDYLIIQSFCDRWVTYAMAELVKHKRNDLPLLLGEHLKLARSLGMKTSGGVTEMLGRLLQKSAVLKKQFRTGLTPSIIELRKDALARWDEAQANWLSLVAPNDHALEGDVLHTALQTAMKAKPDGSLASVVKKSLSEIRSEVGVAELFADCENAEDFADLISGMTQQVKSLADSGDYPADMTPDSLTLMESLTGLTEGGVWLTITKLRGITQSEDNTQRQWQLLCELDGALITRLMIAMQYWQLMYKRVSGAIAAYNNSHGGHRINECRAQIDTTLQELDLVLEKLQQAAGKHDDNA